MANGQFDLSGNSGAFKGYILWFADANISGNYSEVRATLFVRKDDGYTTSGYYSHSLSIGGEEVDSGSQYIQLGADWYSVAYGTKRIYHDSNGNATCTISGRCDGPSGTGLSGKYVSGSSNVILDSIGRASSVSVGASSVQMGKNLTISISRASSSFKHTLKYSFGGAYGTIATNVDMSYAWTVLDLAQYCNNATSGICTITCETYNGGNYIGSSSTTVELTVPNATTPTFPNGDVILGTGNTISTPRNSANFTIRLSYTFKNASGNIQEHKKDTAVWTPDYDLAKEIPQYTQGTGTLTCVTLNGTAEVGTVTATFRIQVPENSETRPKLDDSGIILTPISSLPDDLSDLYIRGKTGLKGEFTAKSDYSYIATYEMTASGVTVEGNPAEIPMLSGEGTVRVLVKVTDARGFTTTATKDIFVYPYSRPKVIPFTGYSNIICERATASGELVTNGTYLAIKAGKQFNSLEVNGENKNTCVLQYRYRISTASDFSQWIVLLAEDSQSNEISVLISDVVSSTATSYVIEIQAVDTLGGSHTLMFQVMTQAISMVLYPGIDGVGFGKYPEEPHVVDIASHMTLKIRGKLEVFGNDWVTLPFAEGVSESAIIGGRSDGSGCQYKVSNGNNVLVAFNCSFSFNGNPVTINKEQIPDEYRPKQKVQTLCPVNDRAVALVSVDERGFVAVEWIQRMTDTVETVSFDMLWIDAYLNYWVQGG